MYRKGQIVRIKRSNKYFKSNQLVEIIGNPDHTSVYVNTGEECWFVNIDNIKPTLKEILIKL